MKTIHINPMGKPRLTQRDRWKKRPVMQRWLAYKDELRLKVGELKLDTIQIKLYLPMPKSWSKKKRADMIGQPHQQKPDIDNLVKGFLDAVMNEDKTVFSVTASKYWAEHGRIEYE